MRIWNLDNKDHYELFAKFEIPGIHTHGDSHILKRECVRIAALNSFHIPPVPGSQWAFRIFAKSKNMIDVDNVPKIIVDAFCGAEISKDNSSHKSLKLYDRDTLENVCMVQVAGELVSGDPSTVVEIFRCL